jgi:shikimate dehydrogenase
MNISAKTKLYGSFSENPGNNGAVFFNQAFGKYNIDAIYKPFKSTNTKGVADSIRILNFAGAAVSSPHKEKIMAYLDDIDSMADEIGAVNTVVVDDGRLIGYNTDWYGVQSVLQDANITALSIFGNGGFSRTVQYVCSMMNIEYTVLKRGDTIPLDISVFNATPIEIQHPHLIDGRPTTAVGLKIFEVLARHQFKLYTGIDYE